MSLGLKNGSVVRIRTRNDVFIGKCICYPDRSIGIVKQKFILNGEKTEAFKRENTEEEWLESAKLLVVPNKTANDSYLSEIHINADLIESWQLVSFDELFVNCLKTHYDVSSYYYLNEEDIVKEMPNTTTNFATNGYCTGDLR